MTIFSSWASFLCSVVRLQIKNKTHHTTIVGQGKNFNFFSFLKNFHLLAPSWCDAVDTKNKFFTQCCQIVPIFSRQNSSLIKFEWSLLYSKHSWQCQSGAAIVAAVINLSKSNLCLVPLSYLSSTCNEMNNRICPSGKLLSSCKIWAIHGIFVLFLIFSNITNQWQKVVSIFFWKRLFGIRTLVHKMEVAVETTELWRSTSSCP